MRNLSRFLALRHAERLFLLRCLSVVVAMRLGLTFLSYDRLRRRIVSMDARAPADIGDLRRIAWGVAAAARFVPRASCLTQALAGQYLLARGGKTSKIRIGIERGTGMQLKAHAWLVSGDYVVLGGPVRSFANYAHLTDFG